MAMTLPADISVYRAEHARRSARQRTAREALRSEVLAMTRTALRELLSDEPTIRGAWIFGSVLKPGCFGERSDVDIAVDSDDPEAESRLWSALEEKLRRDVDLRPLKDKVARIVEREGERVDG